MASSTIKDIARRAGLSIATVSRVINGNYPVSEESRKKVLLAIQELNYKPNAVARSLKTESTHTIGILVSDIANPFFMQIAKAVENVVSKNHYNIIVCSSEEDEEKEIRYLKMLFEKRVDGIILSPSGKGNLLAKELETSDIPVVLIDRTIKGLDLDTVAEDSYKGAYMLIRYLLSLGHTEIAIIDGPHSSSTGCERLKGYLDALEHSGQRAKESLIRCGNYTMEYGYDEACKLFKGDNTFTAIFAANNLIAKGVIAAARDMGRSIPDDFSLVCFGEKELVRLVNPPVTCIMQKPMEIGLKAGEIVMERITGKKSNIQSMILPPEIYVGGSCKEIKRTRD